MVSYILRVLALLLQYHYVVLKEKNGGMNNEKNSHIKSNFFRPGLLHESGPRWQKPDFLLTNCAHIIFVPRLVETILQLTLTSI